MYFMFNCQKMCLHMYKLYMCGCITAAFNLTNTGCHWRLHIPWPNKACQHARWCNTAQATNMSLNSIKCGVIVINNRLGFSSWNVYIIQKPQWNFKLFSVCNILSSLRSCVISWVPWLSSCMIWFLCHMTRLEYITCRPTTERELLLWEWCSFLVTDFIRNEISVPMPYCSGVRALK